MKINWRAKIKERKEDTRKVVCSYKLFSQLFLFRGRGRWPHKVRKFRGKAKTLPMLAETKSLLLALRPEIYSEEQAIYQIKPQTLQSVFTRAATQAGISGLSLHDLRTEAISRMLELGLPVPIVACFTGHRDHSTIIRIYTNLHAQKIITNINLISQINRSHAGLL